MRLSRYEPIKPDEIDRVLGRLAEILRDMSPEVISGFEVNCFPWRNDRRLQAVEGRQIVSVCIDLPSDPVDPRAKGYTIRERPDDLGDLGFGTLFNEDD